MNISRAGSPGFSWPKLFYSTLNCSKIMKDVRLLLDHPLVNAVFNNVCGVHFCVHRGPLNRIMLVLILCLARLILVLQTAVWCS